MSLCEVLVIFLPIFKNDVGLKKIDLLRIFRKTFLKLKEPETQDVKNRFMYLRMRTGFDVKHLIGSIIFFFNYSLSEIKTNCSSNY